MVIGSQNDGKTGILKKIDGKDGIVKYAGGAERDIIPLQVRTEAIAVLVELDDITVVVVVVVFFSLAFHPSSMTLADVVVAPGFGSICRGYCK